MTWGRWDGSSSVASRATTSSRSWRPPGEPVVDKPGKGTSYATDLSTLLRARGIDRLIIAGVTTEICVSTTVREANDRGYECLVLSDCTASYSPEFHTATLAMIQAQAGILGWVDNSTALLTATGHE